MSGFDSNVPARKPRTQIGRVITELTSPEPEDGSRDEVRDEAPAARNGAAHDSVAPERRAEEGSATEAVPASPSRTLERVLESSRTSHPQTAAEPIRPAPGDNARLDAGRERVSALRERLSAASRPAATAAEPKRTAAAVVEIVQELRSRLEEALRERTELIGKVDDAEAALQRARAELEKERRLRESVEARSEERGRIADEAVAEAEALASERDQVLAELAEQRRLDDEQAELLIQAEAALSARDAERAEAASEIAELHEQLEAKDAQLADMEGRLKAAGADQRRAEARLAEMEAEMGRLAEAREALESIEATVTRRGRARPVD